jgi:transcriptional regulator with XRE-family HTH domain
MTNERLRSAIQSAGLSIELLSDRAGVDPKTVERWITKDRVPHRAHRDVLTRLLGKPEAFLWPSTESEARTQSASAAEFAGLHVSRGGIPAGTWTSLLDQASESIDLLAYSASFLHDSVDNYGEKLLEKAESGVQVRLCFADPDSESVIRRGEEEGIGHLLGARCELTWAYCSPLLESRGVKARKHDDTVYASIFRFDEVLLANVHSLGTPASHAPVLQIQRVAGGRLFSTYMQSFERTWDRATDVVGQQVA